MIFLFESLYEIIWYLLDISVIFIRSEIVLMSILNIFCSNSFQLLGKCGIAAIHVTSRSFLTAFLAITIFTAELTQHYEFYRGFYWGILIGGGNFWLLDVSNIHIWFSRTLRLQMVFVVDVCYVYVIILLFLIFILKGDHRSISSYFLC